MRPSSGRTESNEGVTSVRKAHHDSPSIGQGREDGRPLPGHIADDTIRWPDPSPLDSWWARIMGTTAP